MTAPGYDARGMTVPGVPAIAIGVTENIAWGITALGGDNGDALKYKVRSASLPAKGETVESLQKGDLSTILGGAGWRVSDREYLTISGWKRFLERYETYEVLDLKGRRMITETTLYTEAGPVMYDQRDSVFVLKWVGMFPDREGASFLAMNEAKNIDEFRVAIRDLTTSQNLICCDKDGHIAYFPTGKYPLREYDGAKVADGAVTNTVWSNWIDTGKLPALIDPKRGYIVSANQAIYAQAAADLLHQGSAIGMPDLDKDLGGYRAYGHRAKQITDLIEEAKSHGKISRTDVARIQCDTYSQLGAGFRDSPENAQRLVP